MRSLFAFSTAFVLAEMCLGAAIAAREGATLTEGTKVVLTGGSATRNYERRGENDEKIADLQV